MENEQLQETIELLASKNKEISENRKVINKLQHEIIDLIDINNTPHYNISDYVSLTMLFTVHMIIFAIIDKLIF